MYSKYLNEIFENLKKGYRYGRKIDYVKYPYFENNLYFFKSTVNGKELFGYEHFGQSAIAATRKNLKWLIETIFDQSAEQFILAHEKELFVAIVTPLDDDGKQLSDETGLYLLNDTKLVDSEYNLIAEYDGSLPLKDFINEIYFYSCECSYRINFSRHLDNEGII